MKNTINNSILLGLALCGASSITCAGFTITNSAESTGEVVINCGSATTYLQPGLQMTCGKQCGSMYTTPNTPTVAIIGLGDTTVSNVNGAYSSVPKQATGACSQ